MNDLLLVGDAASTPLDPDERADLIQAYIALRSELDEAEQANIYGAEDWAFKRVRDVLADSGVIAPPVPK